MNILRTIETFYPYVTGPTKQAFRISRELELRGFSSPILTTYCDVDRQLPAREHYRGVSVTRYRNQLRLMRYCISLGMVRGYKDCDLIHSHNYRNFQTDLSILVSKVKKKPFVLSTHGALLGYKRYLAGKLARFPYVLYDAVTFKLAAKKADVVVVSSQVEYEDALEFGIVEEKLRLIPAGIDVKDYELPVERENSEIKLLFVGRIARNRRLETLVQALKDIDKAVLLTIVGSEEKTSSVSRRGYLEELIALAKKLGVEDRVRFVGPRFDDELVKCYCLADIFVYPSRYESFGQPLLEAAAAGLPIISTPVGVARDIVKNGKTGYLIEYNNPTMLAERVTTLSDEYTRNNCSRAIRELVKNNYAWDDIIEKYIALYQEPMLSP
ncbi:MAG: glycosyltransferase family 4 protein [Deltaproteobacteria bacterium]|nr:glycosyltransferase family 4 protein [Deltaproteobacteria bacterium]